MSRSNQNENANPSTRWFEWDGANGGLTYYDKPSKQTIKVELPFTFILLDQLGTIKGWHESSKSGIYSNEVKDTNREPFIVKAFKGGPLASGFWSNIKNEVKACGGKFHVNLYVVFYNDSAELVIGSVLFKGAALNAWIEFKKKNAVHVYKKAIRITGSAQDKKGSIVYHVPTFELQEISADTNNFAVALDKELQDYLSAYFGRKRTVEQAEANAEDVPAPVDAPAEKDSDDDLPF